MSADAFPVASALLRELRASMDERSIVFWRKALARPVSTEPRVRVLSELSLAETDWLEAALRTGSTSAEVCARLNITCQSIGPFCRRRGIER